MKVLLLGNGGREHTIAEAIKRNKEAKLYAFMNARNPGIAKLCSDFFIGDILDVKSVSDYAEKKNIDFAVVGPEAPLEKGIADALGEKAIPCIGPKRGMVRLETSKCFTRKLLEKYKIKANPKFKIFDSLEGVEDYLDELGDYVVKPDGLTGGKGVKVFNEHLKGKNDTIAYCQELISKGSRFIIEEKLDGEEFSLQTLSDGKHILDTIPAQDHKRAYEDDKGMNTGGMSSYSCENHLLPFLNKKDLDDAREITTEVAKALRKELKDRYVGVMYGGFILTKNGIKLLEYNSRFADPEIMNVLPIMKNDFVEVCEAMIDGKLNEMELEFEENATVCKYVVPIGYPENPLKNEKIEINRINSAKLYFAAIDERDDGLYMTGSRAIACVGIAKNLDKAERIAEQAVKGIRGRTFHRSDIGTRKLIEKRIEHIKRIMSS